MRQLVSRTFARLLRPMAAAAKAAPASGDTGRTILPDAASGYMIAVD